jgi:hypothetical protein
VDEKPELLIDCGVGIGLSYQRHVGKPFPSKIYISHNHPDHTGDLPIVIGQTDNKRPAILGHSSVLKIIQEHTFHDAPKTQSDMIAKINWVESNKEDIVCLNYDLCLHLFKSVHSYTTYGFILTHEGKPILGYPADSGFDEAIYKRVTKAPIAILDGRDVGNADHASLSQIDNFAASVPQCSIWVVHYEETDYQFLSPNVKLMNEGSNISLI